MIIITEADRQAFIAKLNKVKLVNDEGVVTPWQCDAKPYVKNRSAAINRLYHMGINEIAKHTGSGVVHETRIIKLDFGCPILIAESSSFAALYGDLISNIEYEAALESMDFISVTRLFNNKMMCDLLERVDQYAYKLGVQLTKPDDLMIEAFK